MTQATLADHLTRRILAVLQTESLGGGDEDDPPRQARQIAESLVREAVGSGLPLIQMDIENQALGGGNTAEVVDQVILHAPFVFKLDRQTAKLAEEGNAMRAIKQDKRLPERYRAAWPTVYAVRETSPYAYLMEIFPKADGWVSLEDRLYPKQPGTGLSFDEVLTVGGEVLTLMFEGFEHAIDTRSQPNLDSDYISRIGERLAKAAQRDSRFESKPLLVNGKSLRPWREYMAVLDRYKDVILTIAPPFRTITHGDPNPGNLMLRLQADGIETKFIDPKEWVYGDYLFDIAKLTHFLQATGPVEKPENPADVRVDYQTQDTGAKLDYQFVQPAWTEPLVQACFAKAGAFAATHQDCHWEARYELAMASNLLGLPLGRLTHKKNPRPEAALMLYAEGLVWLDRFCTRLEGGGNAAAAFVKFALETDPAPPALMQVWQRIEREVPNLSLATDRRGFRLLHWPPTRPNGQGKPQELSLEHEARLKPGSEAGLGRLLENLHDPRQLPLKALLLPGIAAEYGDLLVSRHDRANGPQSVDHYYDVPESAPQGRLIPRLYTLRRRLRTSHFMTWASAEPDPQDGEAATQPSPLNLELPFIALGAGGLTVRLEFNWLDDDTISLTEAFNPEIPESIRANNPLYLATWLDGHSFAGAEPVIEHTTFREKFSLVDGEGEKHFAVNIDRITAQSLATGRMGSYIDVDISSYRPINEAELQKLAAFCKSIAKTYGLVPNFCTKAYRDALVVGLLAK